MKQQEKKQIPKKQGETSDSVTIMTDGQKTPEPENPNGKIEFNQKYFTICVYALFVIGIGALLVYFIMNGSIVSNFFRQLTTVLSPFLAAFFIAYIINPAVVTLEHSLFNKKLKLKNQKVRMALSILTAYVLLISIITIALFYVTPQVIQSIHDLTLKLESVPIIYNDLLNYLSNIEQEFPYIDFASLEKAINDLLPNIVNFGTNLVTNVIPALLNFSLNFAKLLINILLSVVISCYLLSDKRTLQKNAARTLYAVIPKKTSDAFLVHAKESNRIFSKFIVGKSIDSLIIGIICFVCMSLLRFPYALLLSVLVGLTNMIPYFGPFIGAIPGVLIYLLTKPIHALFFALFILVLQQFDGLYLGPKILGESTGLKPLWVIFGITLGGAYGGVIGMFLGVPITAVAAYLLNQFVTARLKKKNIIVE